MRLSIPFLLACLILSASPAMADDAATSDRDFVAEGAKVFQRSCRSCHGATASSGSGGDIRGSDRSTVANAVEGFESMPPVDLSEDEITAVAAYLGQLAGQD